MKSTSINWMNWRNALALVITVLVAGCFIVVVAAAIQHYAPPRPHYTCGVHYSVSEYVTHSTEWQIRADEKCGGTPLDEE